MVEAEVGMEETKVAAPARMRPIRATLPREPTILLTSSLNTSHSSYFHLTPKLARVICIFGYARVFPVIRGEGKREVSIFVSSFVLDLLPAILVYSDLLNSLPRK